MIEIFVCLHIFLINIYFSYAAVNYGYQENFGVDYHTEDVMAERSAVSRRHCSQLCMESNCTGANYSPASSQCQLLNADVTRVIPKSGSTALFRRGKCDLFLKICIHLITFVKAFCIPNHTFFISIYNIGNSYII